MILLELLPRTLGKFRIEPDASEDTIEDVSDSPEINLDYCFSDLKDLCWRDEDFLCGRLSDGSAPEDFESIGSYFD